MPFSNEHACRIKNPDSFDSIRRENNAQQSGGKGLDILWGIKGGNTNVQAIRYDKNKWTADEARSHCSGRGGRFEAAGD